MKPPKKKKEQDRRPTDTARGKSNPATSRHTVVEPASKTQRTNTAAQSSSHVAPQAPLTPNPLNTDDGDVLSAQEQKKYASRSIVSNWDRYEEILSNEELEEDDVTDRGRDFLSSHVTAGGFSSQFRFRDELDWEESGNSDLPGDFQNLNLEDLAFSMSCIPLHERLGIETDIFQAEEISEFEDMAHANRQIFYKQKNREQACEILPLLPPVNSGGQNAIQDVIAPNQALTNVAAIDEHVSSTETVQSVRLTTLPAEDESLIESCTNIPVIAMPLVKSKELGVALEDDFDDELDFLLDMSTKNTPVPKQPIASAPPLATQLSVSDVGSLRLKASSETPKPEFELQKQSLDDDWLDNLLED